MTRRPGDRGAHASYPRTARVNQVLREVLADQLERLADIDERLRLLTVTDVATSSDLRHATVYLSSLDEQREEILEGLRADLQHAIATQVRMKRTPHLHFRADPAVAHGMRVEEILQRVHSECSEKPRSESPRDPEDLDADD